jgi:hypothetical protein
MSSILNLDQQTADQDRELEPSTPNNDYEIVVGRAQIASWLFVSLVVIAVCASLAYLAGETITSQKMARLAAAALPPTPAPAPAVIADPLPQASIVVPPKTDLPSIAKDTNKPAPPLFGDPQPGKVYLQIGAVERGMAMLLTDGLRSHGFDSFVAPGPNQRIFRVLIGPLPDPEAFRQAMVAVDALDLSMFARKYQK